MNPDLARTLAEEDDAETAGGLHADDRTTCYSHKSWFKDCQHMPSHADPVGWIHRTINE